MASWRWLDGLVQVHSELLRVASLLDGGPQPAAAHNPHTPNTATVVRSCTVHRGLRGVLTDCVLLAVAKSGLVGANAAGACVRVCGCICGC